MKKIIGIFAVILAVCLTLSVLTGWLDVPSLWTDEEETTKEPSITTTASGDTDSTDSTDSTNNTDTPEAPDDTVYTSLNAKYSVGGLYITSRNSSYEDDRINNVDYTNEVSYTDFRASDVMKYEMTLEVEKWADYTVVLKFYDDSTNHIFTTDAEDNLVKRLTDTYTKEVTDENTGETSTESYTYYTLFFENLDGDTITLYTTTYDCAVDVYESLYFVEYNDDGDNYLVKAARTNYGEFAGDDNAIQIASVAAGDEIFVNLDTASVQLTVSVGTAEVFSDTGSSQKITVTEPYEGGYIVVTGSWGAPEEAQEYERQFYEMIDVW
ncbi:MAG: hypothetical protein IJ038_05150 [Clostridia bacterium]|nr:hypothetical protein [Clostridia bacterium]